MHLVRLIYASRFKDEEFDPSELNKILETSKFNNQKHEITGELVFGDDYFLQCLEGERELINQLYSNIVKDPRHSSVTLLEYEQISERYFGDWSMKLVLLTEEKINLVRRFSVSGKFNPFMMNPVSALEFMVALNK